MSLKFLTSHYRSPHVHLSATKQPTTTHASNNYKYSYFVHLSSFSSTGKTFIYQFRFWFWFRVFVFGECARVEFRVVHLQYSMTNFKTVLEDHFPGRATSLSSHIGGAKKIIKEKLTIDSFMRLEGHIWKVCRNGHNLQQPVSPPYPP